MDGDTLKTTLNKKFKSYCKVYNFRLTTINKCNRSELSLFSQLMLN